MILRTDIKAIGQYFTISDELQAFVFDKVKYKSECLLEPSFGAGHLLQKFKEYNKNYKMVCYEIDNTIKPIIKFNRYQMRLYCDFTNHTITDKFKTIIGNPPYVKMSSGNLYLKFIEICYNCLDDNGEMIFIVPSDFIKLTSSSSIINKMVKTGNFTDFYFPNNEKLFENANIDVLVFRYEKSKMLNNMVYVNGIEKIYNVSNGIITFSDKNVIGVVLSELFDVYVGMVSAKEEVYKVPCGNIEMLNDKNKKERYIYIENYPTDDTEINEHLLLHKKTLIKRKIRKFSETNWFEWGAPRNIKTILKNWNNKCIYIKNITRNKEVAFIDTVQYFGGSLICIIPKKDIDLTLLLTFLNSDEFKKNYTYSGRFRIGHKLVSNIIIPEQFLLY